jgi:hypothetical protein
VTGAPITLVLPRYALKRDEAAASLGMSLDSFERHVQPHVRLVRRGKLRLVPVAELERWLGENAERALPDRDGPGRSTTRPIGGHTP